MLKGQEGPLPPEPARQAVDTTRASVIVSAGVRLISAACERRWRSSVQAFSYSKLALSGMASTIKAAKP